MKRTVGLLFVLLIGVLSVYAQSANIEKIWVDHNAYENNQSGMRIHVKFDVNGLKNQKIFVSAAFFDEKKENEIKCYLDGYKTSKNTMISYCYTTPTYENSTYNDFQLFMPYYVFNNSNMQSSTYSFYIYISIVSNWKQIATSNWQSFTYTRGDNNIANDNTNVNNNNTYVSRNNNNSTNTSNIIISDLLAYERGDELFEAGKYAEAIGCFEKLANKGDKLAQYGIGLCYHNLQNYTSAFEWYQKAANQGLANAQFWVGYYYDWGLCANGVQGNPFEWYQKAANQGHAKAQYCLGVDYEFGLGGVSIDLAKAFEWYQKAANQGEEMAQNEVGRFYETGRGGVQKNNITALEWYQKAANKGLDEAQYNVGRFYGMPLELYGVKYDPNKAFEWFQKAANQGHAMAQAELGDCYAIGLGVQIDNNKAIEWYQKAANQGNKHAKEQLEILRK